MNERITALHNQAIAYSCDSGGLRISSHIPSDYIEKLSELLIKECAAVAADHVGSIEGVDFGLQEVCYEHFGVTV